MKRSSMPCSLAQVVDASAVSSGPLSKRIAAGLPKHSSSSLMMRVTRRLEIDRKHPLSTVIDSLMFDDSPSVLV